MSTAVHVTVVVPNAKFTGASFVMESIPMISSTVACPIDTKL